MSENSGTIVSHTDIPSPLVMTAVVGEIAHLREFVASFSVYDLLQDMDTTCIEAIENETDAELVATRIRRIAALALIALRNMDVPLRMDVFHSKVDCDFKLNRKGS